MNEKKSEIFKDSVEFVEDTANLTKEQKMMVLGYMRGLADGSRIHTNTDSKPA